MQGIGMIYQRQYSHISSNKFSATSAEYIGNFAVHNHPIHRSKQLTHWGWVTHICVSKQTNIGSDNGLSPGRRQAIIWTNAGILLIGPLGTNFSEISIEIHILSFKKMHLKMSSGKWRPFFLGLNKRTHPFSSAAPMLFLNAMWRPTSGAERCPWVSKSWI